VRFFERKTNNEAKKKKTPLARSIDDRDDDLDPHQQQQNK